MKKPNQGNTRYFQIIDSHIKSYLLGFITADGCIQNNGNKSYGLSITLHSKDRYIIDKLKEEMGCENKILHLTTPASHNGQPKDHYRFSLFNKDLFNDLQNHGLEERKSTTMLNIIPNIPKEYRKSFILGYFDGDGSIILPVSSIKENSKYKAGPNQIKIVFRGTEIFLKGIVEELEISKFSLFKDKQRNCWTLAINHKQEVLKIFNLYKDSNFYLTRKHDRFLERINTVQTISPS